MIDNELFINDSKRDTNDTSYHQTTNMAKRIDYLDNEREEEVEEEVDRGLDFDTPEEYLLYHSRDGNQKQVQRMLSLMQSKDIELDINCKGKQKSNNGWTALHLSSYFGHISIVTELLKHNVDVNVINDTGDTPLHKAAYTGRDDIVLLLVANNADLFVINGDGLTPRELARTDTVRDILLAAEEADLKKREQQFISAARNGDTETMKSLLSDTSYPMNINCYDDAGNTALHCAAYRNQKEVAIFLLKNGIDVSSKNKRGQIAAALAPSVLMKQLLQEVQPLIVPTLKSKGVARFEGPLLRSRRFLGWKLIWAVLERGVFSFFASRADATTGAKRKGYKYLESSIVEARDDDDASFVIYFSDRSRTLLSVAKSRPLLIDRQKWLAALNEHIYYGTNFMREGTRFDDSDDDELAELMPIGSLQAMLQTAHSHHTILAKHIKALLQLSDDIHCAEKQLSQSNSSISSTSNGVANAANDSFLNTSSGSNISATNLSSDILQSSLPSLKFHLNLILESSNNTNASLTQCMAVLTHQDDVRQLLLKQEQEKVRVLEDALQVLAREHHDLEKSVANSVPYYHSPPRSQSVCMSDTDVDEFFDAFDDNEYDVKDRDTDECTLTAGTTTNNSSSGDDNDMNSNLASIRTVTGDYVTPQSSLINDLNDREEECTETNISSKSDTRKRLPSAMVPRDEVSLWSILKHCIGKELSKITFPVVFNEPISFLQRMTETLEYAHYLNIADQCHDPVERIENVCAFIVSSYSSNWLRLNKPFNPLLGETFEYELEDLGIKVVLEQVSHHPPVSAWYAESPHFIFHGTSAPKLKFWGKSIEVRPEGKLTLKLKSTGDVYTWKSINCCVHNIIVGKLWFEQYGMMEVVEETNGIRASLNFRAAGWFGKDLHRFDGFIYSKTKEKLRFIYGKWSDYLKTASVNDYEDYMNTHSQRFRVPDKPLDSSSSSTPRKVMSKLNSLTRQLTGSDSNTTNNTTITTTTNTNSNSNADNNSSDEASDLPPELKNGDIPKSDSSHSLDIPNSRILWQVNPRPEYSSQYYNFTLFSMSLNHLNDRLAKILPPTDSRFRPDIRKLEEGDLDNAASEKNRLEEKQREVRRIRRKKKENYEPLWFKKEQNARTKEEDWLFTGQYWDRNYTKSPFIF